MAMGTVAYSVVMRADGPSSKLSGRLMSLRSACAIWRQDFADDFFRKTADKIGAVVGRQRGDELGRLSAPAGGKLAGGLLEGRKNQRAAVVAEDLERPRQLFRPGPRPSSAACRRCRFSENYAACIVRTQRTSSRNSNQQWIHDASSTHENKFCFE
jgi:hypothetical protein